MSQHEVPGYALDAQRVVDLQLEFGDPAEAFEAIQVTLEEHPGDEFLVEMLGAFLRNRLEVTQEQREFYLRHLLTLASCLFAEKQNEQTIELLERAYALGFYNREVIDLMCALYARLGRANESRELLKLHVDARSLEPDSGTDYDLPDPESVERPSTFEDQDTDSIDTIQ